MEVVGEAWTAWQCVRRRGHPCPLPGAASHLVHPSAPAGPKAARLQAPPPPTVGLQLMGGGGGGDRRGQGQGIKVETGKLPTAPETGNPTTSSNPYPIAGRSAAVSLPHRRNRTVMCPKSPSPQGARRLLSPLNPTGHPLPPACLRSVSGSVLRGVCQGCARNRGHPPDTLRQPPRCVPTWVPDSAPVGGVLVGMGHMTIRFCEHP